MRLEAVKRRGGYIEFKPMYLSRIPIYPIDEEDPDDVAAREAIADYVGTMLDLHAQRADATTDTERDKLQQRIDEVDAEIDRQVYELYGLSEGEIAIVEGDITY